MKDKLTKKRIKVDYASMIIYLHLDGDFVLYSFKNKHNISARRLAFAFLRSKKVDIQGVYYEMKEKGIRCDNDMTLDNRHPNDENFLCVPPFDHRKEEFVECIDNTPDWMK